MCPLCGKDSEWEHGTGPAATSYCCPLIIILIIFFIDLLPITNCSSPHFN